MDLSLVMFKSDGTRRDFPITKPRVVLGRKSSCDLRIPLTSVSRQHCEIVVEGSSAVVRDLGSSNGTYHNSTRVIEAELAAGDELVVGPVVFIAVINGVPAEIEPVRTIVEKAGLGSPVRSVSAEPGDAGPAPLGLEVEPAPVDPEEDPIAAIGAMADAEPTDPDASNDSDMTLIEGMASSSAGGDELIDDIELLTLEDDLENDKA